MLARTSSFPSNVAITLLLLLLFVWALPCTILGQLWPGLLRFCVDPLRHDNVTTPSNPTLSPATNTLSTPVFHCMRPSLFAASCHSVVATNLVCKTPNRSLSHHPLNIFPFTPSLHLTSITFLFHFRFTFLSSLSYYSNFIQSSSLLSNFRYCTYACAS